MSNFTFYIYGYFTVLGAPFACWLVTVTVTYLAHEGLGTNGPTTTTTADTDNIDCNLGVR